MKNIYGRLSKLEDRLGVRGDLFLVVLSDAGTRGLDEDTCVQILREGGFIPASGVATVDLTLVPAGPSAEEVRRFLRENGSRICGSHIAHNPTSSEVNTAFRVHLS